MVRDKRRTGREYALDVPNTVVGVLWKERRRVGTQPGLNGPDAGSRIVSCVLVRSENKL